MGIAGRHTRVHANAGIGPNLSPNLFCNLSGLPSQIPCDSEGPAAGVDHVMRSILQGVHESRPGTGTSNQIENRSHSHSGRDRKVDGRYDVTE